MSDRIDLSEKRATFSEHWSPRTIAQFKSQISHRRRTWRHRTPVSCTSKSASLLWPCVAFVHERHWLRSGYIAGLNPVDAESCTFDHGADRAVEVTATAETSPNRRQPILPPTHGLIGCKAMFDEQELAARPQYAPHVC